MLNSRYAAGTITFAQRTCVGRPSRLNTTIRACPIAVVGATSRSIESVTGSPISCSSDRMSPNVHSRKWHTQSSANRIRVFTVGFARPGSTCSASLNGLSLPRPRKNAPRSGPRRGSKDPSVRLRQTAVEQTGVADADSGQDVESDGAAAFDRVELGLIAYLPGGLV